MIVGISFSIFAREMYKEVLIYKVVPTSSQVARAKQMAVELGELRNSITHGEGNAHGFLGEILVAEAIGAQHSNSFDHDLVLAAGSGLITIDVKTKRCTSTPWPNYECSVADYNPDQQCDFYIFVRILENFETAWILGKIRKEEYYRKAVFRRKGEKDPNGLKGVDFHFTADCYNLPISELMPIKYMIA